MPIGKGLMLLRVVGEPRVGENYVSLYCATIEGAKKKPEDAGPDYKAEYYTSAMINVVATADWCMASLREVKQRDVIVFDLPNGLSVSDEYLYIGESVDDKGNPVLDEEGNPVLVIDTLSDKDVEDYKEDELKEALKAKEIRRVQKFTAFNPFSVYRCERLGAPSEGGGGGGKSSRRGSTQRRTRSARPGGNLPDDGDDDE